MYEGSVCVCCMSTESLEELFSYKTSMYSKVNYADLLKSCLNIKISETEGHDSICEDCCTKLKECVNFKKQTLKSIAILSSVDINDLINEEDVKNLGFFESKDCLSYTDDQNLNNKPTEFEVQSVELNFETGKPNDDLTYQSRDNSEEHLSFCDNENVAPDVKVKKKSKTKKRKVKRQLLRKTSAKVQTKSKKMTKKDDKEGSFKTKMPYEISKDELKCRECGKEFASHRTLRIHYNIHFGSHVCKTCQKGFMSRKTLQKHQMSHMAGPFPCKQCGKIYASIHTLKTHKTWQHDGKYQYKCEDCEERFKSSWERDKHRQAKHGGTARNNCLYCGKTFMYRVQLSKHILSQHEVKLFPCPVCGVKFKSTNLKLHLLSIHGIGKRYMCPLPSCKAVHFYKSTLKLHLRTHFDDRRFVCKLCSQAFVQKCALRTHTKAHIRRGEFSGDPDSLVAYMEKPDDNYTRILESIEKESSEMSSLSWPSSKRSIELADDIIDLEEDLDEILLDDDRFHVPSDLE